MSRTDRKLSSPVFRLTRRALVGSSVAAAALARLGPASTAARQDEAGDPTTWRPWLLASADELRPAAPPEPTAAEVDELLEFQSKRTDETAAAVQRWNRPGRDPLVDVGLDLADEFGLSGPRVARAQALLRTAMYDAVLAALDAQAAYPRDAPAAADSRLTPEAGVATDSTSFPSEHAAVAGAAAPVLAYLFPDAEAGRFDTLATEAAESRLWAGASYRSDVEAGFGARARGRRAGGRARQDRRLRRQVGRLRPPDRSRLLGAHPARLPRRSGRAAGRHLADLGHAERRRGAPRRPTRPTTPRAGGRVGGGAGGGRRPSRWSRPGSSSTG